MVKCILGLLPAETMSPPALLCTNLRQDLISLGPLKSFPALGFYRTMKKKINLHVAFKALHKGHTISWWIEN